MSRRAGFTTAEAMVAAALAGIAMAGLASAASLATATLRLARDTATAVALATDGLERVRSGEAPPFDVTPGAEGQPFVRGCWALGGRGRPRRVQCRVAWGTHDLALATEVPP
jgi:hypothetical protein